ncbi:hypothetical protein [Marinobacter sp. SS21]|uniref:hypothetical protein n=1 Tax=Marinobacter sp. SS21 TaxID=2979460 RepID=UPI00232B74C0|nr:hypothetical protein [Marinobacter sp. SS21]MDC0661093.1 hypothetical protein [Marinobacter sp. SS21]
MSPGQAGRSCPLHYRYRPELLCQAPESWPDDVLYVIGGLYGNPFALDAIEAMAAEERAAGRSVRLLFNGDFNWFNASAPWFADINRRVLRYDASLGNVELELASPSSDAGCGCGYPDFVEDGVVARSNQIIQRLQQQAHAHPEIQRQLKALPRWRCMIFGGLKILVLHGDPESLAGWGLSRERLARQGAGQLAHWFRQTGADLILCSHTCLPLMWSGQVDGRSCGLINNGAAGLANLAGDHRGLVVRLAASGPSVAPLVGLQAGVLSAALVPVDFALDDWLALFDRLWPAGSAAAVSYRSRVRSGTALAPDEIRMSC